MPNSESRKRAAGEPSAQSEAPCRCIAAGEGGVHWPSDHTQPAAVVEDEARDASSQTALRRVVELAIARSPELPNGFLGEDITVAILASDWLADHDARLVEQARGDMAHWEAKWRAEGAQEALLDAAESLPTGVSHFGLCDWLRQRATIARAGQEAGA